MSRRLHAYTMGISFAALTRCFDIRSEHETDPHKPRPRSKGEKARNRKNKGR